ncbi:response regulator (plasmid) [Azospirillum humicireducens]|uniref:Response regulator n=1 Tax=Azospirillum humicireducens TaxID=1226968 RepID=A0A2R4VPQ8_9PROT|nr:response regulator [Azospirillum humicireducens]AWB06422.1 response regulator [Azospirillum humicireducens]
MTDANISDLTVLIVEDEPLIAMSLEDALLDRGVTCLGPAGSVTAALEMIAAGGFDIALLDVNLRGERVDAVADRLAAAGIPFIFTTGHGAEGLPDAHRARPVVGKPFRDLDIADALARHRPR